MAKRYSPKLKFSSCPEGIAGRQNGGPSGEKLWSSSQYGQQLEANAARVGGRNIC